ncbi:hypothetical protein D3C78_1536820 [compost metagenome]
MPTLDEQREQTLELAAILSTVVQDMLGFGLFWQQAGQQTADYGVGIELVESGIGFQLRHVAAGVVHGGQRQARGILLAAQVASQATIQAYPQLGQVFSERFALAHAHRREDVVVVCTK